MNLLASLSQNKIAITVVRDSDQLSVMRNVKIKNLHVRFASTVFRHILDNGVSKVDGRILQPIEIDIETIVSDIESLELLNNAFLDVSNTFTITSKGLVFKEMIFVGEDFSNTGRMLNATPITYKFRQVLLNSNLNQTDFKNSADSDAQHKGLISSLTQSVTNTVSNVVSSIIGV